MKVKAGSPALSEAFFPLATASAHPTTRLASTVSVCGVPDRSSGWAGCCGCQRSLQKKARAQVVGWLKLLENSEFRRAAGQGHNPYDTAWMWRELKVEDSR